MISPSNTSIRLYEARRDAFELLMCRYMECPIEWLRTARERCSKVLANHNTSEFQEKRGEKSGDFQEKRGETRSEKSGAKSGENCAVASGRARSTREIERGMSKRSDGKT